MNTLAHEQAPVKPTLAQLAEAKRLPVEFLEGLGLHDLPEGGVGIPYFGVTGEDVAVKRRMALKAKDGSYWPKRMPLAAYGQWRTDRANRAGLQFVVEGESDCWALWHHHWPALGLPGANTAKTLLKEHVECVNHVFIHREPDNGGDAFVHAVAARLLQLRFKGKVWELRMPEGVKDFADLHVQHATDQQAFYLAMQMCLLRSARIDLNRLREEDAEKRIYNRIWSRLKAELPEAVKLLVAEAMEGVRP